MNRQRDGRRPEGLDPPAVERVEEPDRDPGPDREPRITGSQVALGLVAAVVVLVIIVIFIGRAAGLSNISSTLREGDGQWLVVCAVGQVVVFLGYTGVFQCAVAFEGGPTVPRGLALRVVISGFALSQVVAAGGAAGLAVNYWALRRLGFERRDSEVRVIGLATVVYVAFAAIAWVAAVLTLLIGDAPLGATLPWIVIIPALWLLALWFTDASRAAAWSAPQGGFLRRALSTGVGAAWWARRIVQGPTGRRTLLWAAAYWAGDIASLWGALHAFGQRPSLPALVLVYVIGYVAQAVPIPLIATGGMDAAMTFALHMVGVPLDAALVAVLTHRVFAFWIPLLPGLVMAVFLPRTGAALAEIGGQPASPGWRPIARRAQNGESRGTDRAGSSGHHG